MFLVVEKIFLDGNCKLVSKEFISTTTPVEYICECGRLAKITVAKFLIGRRCEECGFEKLRGKNNSNYNHNLTDEEREIRRNYPEYRNWRKNVFIRDNFLCQCCLDPKNNRLVAHHILNYSDHHDLRIDVENGVTLCESCHSSFHKIYKKSNNTLFQLDEFIKLLLTY